MLHLFFRFLFKDFFGKRKVRVYVYYRSIRFFAGGIGLFVHSFFFVLSPEGGGGDCSEESRAGAYLIWILIFLDFDWFFYYFCSCFRFLWSG